ncbi:Lateral organ boundaries domain containing protein [Parasponia andersonii]|uniref:Lateral organ boundaries domain containing protein n=1 Tax=Parasponia andersonii TaxID=3476 RepID=A0A2P5E0F4_PARAD|nr:Lateral organ boundaries domain containing protein [Parasponia andersonii]
MKGGHEPRSSSSCAACKFLKRRCTPTCIFAPYFRSDEPKKFAKVHKVFGASNVSKILIEVPEEQREDTVNSLAYEAEARLRDPVYGCIGAIALLQRKMAELQRDLAVARARLARFAATSSPSSSSPYSPILDGRLISEAAYSGLPAACAGLNSTNDGLISPSSFEFGQNGSIYDFSFVPYIL